MQYRYSIDFGSGYVDVPQPMNHASVKIQIVFTDGQAQASIMGTDLEWWGDTAHKINDYVEQGLSGGRGIYEGLPLRVEACNQNLGFDLILDLANENTRFECDRVLCPIKEVGKIDWLNTIAGSFNFWYLATPVTQGGAGIINFNDYKQIPYCVSEIPDGTTVATLSTSLFLVVWQAYSTTKVLIKDTSKLIGDLANVITVAILLADIANAVVDIVELYFLINEIIKLVNEIIDAIIQPKKYKLGMRVEDLFLKACQYLGLTFQSTIFTDPKSLYYNTTWIPKKVVLPIAPSNPFDIATNFKRPANELSGIGNPYGYYDGTFKEFIEDVMVLFNAEIVIGNDGVLQVEEKHYWNLQNPFIVTNTDEIGYTYNLPAPHGTNAAECPSNYSLAFQLDENELNTIHKYTGTTCTVQVQPFSIGNKKHLLNSEGVVITFPCALAKRKEYFTAPEILISNMIDDLNAVIPVLNFLIPLVFASVLGFVGSLLDALIGLQFDTVPNQIQQRIGWLLLSNDSFDIPKIFIGEAAGTDWEISTGSEEAMSAQGLMFWFHGKNLATRGNQYLTYWDKKFPFCCADFQKVLNSNIFKVPNETGQMVYGKFTKMVWDLENEIAVADYRINELFTTNLTERLIIDGLNGDVRGLGGVNGNVAVISGGGGHWGTGGNQWPQ